MYEKNIIQRQTAIPELVPEAKASKTRTSLYHFTTQGLLPQIKVSSVI
jgi:hypothetical protein